MIFDALPNWAQYSTLPAWNKAFAFLEALSPDAAPGEYPIEGRDIYAIVFDFASKALLHTTLEAHRVYADIHLPLTGPEVHGRFPVGQLALKETYDAARDAEFYHHPDRFAALFTLHPGQFAVYLPGEAHLSQGKTEQHPAELRKVVVKVRADLLRP